MKKIITLILSVFVLFSLTACSSSSEDTSLEETTTAIELPSEVVEGELSSAVMFDVTLTPEWTEETDSRWEGEDYSDVTYNILDGQDIKTSVNIILSSDNVIGFRDTVKNLGIDLYDYAMNNTGDRINIAGYECLVAQGEYWGEDILTYIGRNESSGTTLEIIVSGDFNSEFVAQLLSTITPKTEDLGLIDFPYFWDGEPFMAENLSAQVGSFTITSQNIPLDSPTEINDIFSPRIAKIDSSNIWFGYDDMIFHYSLGNKLSNGEALTSIDTFTEMESDISGNLFVSDFGSSLLKISSDNSITTYSNVTDYISIHPSGEWGLTYFVNSEAKKVSIDGDVATTETYINQGELFNINDIRFTKNYTVLMGSELDGDVQKVMLLDETKTPVFTFGADEFGDNGYFGSITDVIETDNGFIVADGNFREFHFYDTQGAYIGTLSDSDILGTTYPWISDMELMEDGSILIAYSEERADYSGYEVLLTRISGF